MGFRRYIKIYLLSKAISLDGPSANAGPFGQFCQVQKENNCQLIIPSILKILNKVLISAKPLIR